LFSNIREPFFIIKVDAVGLRKKYSGSTKTLEGHVWPVDCMLRTPEEQLLVNQ
jgi:hypothetical protein